MASKKKGNKKMSTQIKKVLRLYDQVRVRDWAGLTERQKTVFTEHIINGLSLQELCDKMGASYSVIAHENVAINRKIEDLFSDLREDAELRELTGLDPQRLRIDTFLS